MGDSIVSRCTAAMKESGHTANCRQSRDAKLRTFAILLLQCKEVSGANCFPNDSLKNRKGRKWRVNRERLWRKLACSRMYINEWSAGGSWVNAKTQRERANSTKNGAESNPQPSCCEAAAQTTASKRTQQETTANW